MATSGRSVGVDAVRIVGLVAVVAGHTLGGRELFYPWHMPLFFFLSGYLWTSGRSLPAELQRRTRSLVVPYLFWLGVVGVLAVARLLAAGRSPWAQLAAMAWGGRQLTVPFTTFWFLTALLVACLLYRLLERLSWSWRAALVVAAVTVAYLVPSLRDWPMSAGVAVPCVAFVLAGHALRHHRAAVRTPLLVAGGLLIAGAALAAVDPGPGMDLKQGQLGLPYLGFAAAIAISAGLLLAAETLLGGLPRWARAAISAVAEVGIVAVLTHMVIVWLLGSSVADGMLFLVALVVPFALGLLLVRTRLGRLAVGSGPPLLRVPAPGRPRDRVAA